ncbi:MAG: asparagine synthetase B family protein [Desulfuromonadaceae bacterium]
MSSLSGIFFRRELDRAPNAVQTVLQQMTAAGKGEHATWFDTHCGVACCPTAGAFSDTKTPINIENNVVFVCTGRLDNREEVCSALGLTSIRSDCNDDGFIILRAYDRWGKQCTERLYGDWAFAAWHLQERRLFLARDHFGITSLYYYSDQNMFAFATSRQALLNLNLAPRKMDELYLAQVLTSWPVYHGERTVHAAIHRLPPAHRLTVTADRLDIDQYWYLENTPLLHLPKRQDYVEAFRELFDDAVLARLKVSRDSDGIASTLSGGLDSSSVTATAAHFLARKGLRIAAYTSVPLADTTRYVDGRFGDEFPLAEKTARYAGNVDITTIDAAGCSPVQAIRRMLQINNEPEHAACNFFWMLELWKQARADGNKVLLIGQFGNAGVSWKGDLFSQAMQFQLRRLGWQKWAKETLKRNMPPSLLALVRRRCANPYLHYRTSAINLAFADRLNLYERRFCDSYNQPPQTALEQRSFLQPGRCAVGALLANLGAAFDIEMRDPTADARVLAFTFSVPDRIFIDPKSGMDRWLIREAMKGRLPDEVRLNRDRGRQAGDLVPRLRACAEEVETALDELALGPAAEYVDVMYMRQAWQTIRAEDTNVAFIKAVTILTRGIMAGLFVNDFYA